MRRPHGSRTRVERVRRREHEQEHADSIYELLGPISEELPADPAPGAQPTPPLPEEAGVSRPPTPAPIAPPANGARPVDPPAVPPEAVPASSTFEFTREVAPVFVPFHDPRSTEGAASASEPTSAARAVLERQSRIGPLLVLAGSIAFGLWSFSPNLSPAAYPNDSAVHVLTVQFALDQLRAGHFPMNAWFPYLSAGSPFLMHYQSTPAILTAVLGLLIGAQHAFTWTLYLGVALWPISIYWSARVFGFDRWVAAVAAACAPLVNSITGYGYEHQSYDWLGNGLWTQMWGMWLLPLAWAYTFRAVRDRRHLFPAIVALGLTIAFHFLTGYLAGLTLVLWIFLRPSKLLRRVTNAALVAIAALAATLWVTVPILKFARWDAVNEFQVGTFWDDSYGARQVLDWLGTGQLFDHGRSFPILTVLVFLGIVTCLVTVRRDERARAVLGAFVLSLLLYFGRPTLASVLNLLPGNQDLFFQRYLMGVQLAGIFLAGIGLVGATRLAIALLARVAARVRSIAPIGPRRAFLAPSAAVVLLVVALFPGWRETAAREGADSVAIGLQQSYDATEGVDIGDLVAKMHALGPGRVYAGSPTNYGATFDVYDVPVYIYLADVKVDAIGFTLRTSALMTDPEVNFDPSVAGDYTAFGVRYLILPTSIQPSVASRFVEQAGSYVLWQVDGVRGLVHVVDTYGSITANHADLGSTTEAFLHSGEITAGIYPTIAYAGAAAASSTLASATPPGGVAGTTVTEDDDLAEGTVRATIEARRSAVVLLSASYDPGWGVTVDGVPAATEMVAPALVGVTVSAGRHVIVFTYHRYEGFPLLFGIAALTLLGFGFGPWLWRRHRRSPAEEAGVR